MAGAGHPGAHDRAGSLEAGGDVLAGGAPHVAGGRDPRGEVGAMAEHVARNHRVRPVLSRAVEQQGRVQRREVAARPLLVDQAHHGHAERPGVRAADDGVRVGAGARRLGAPVAQPGARLGVRGTRDRRRDNGQGDGGEQRDHRDRDTGVMVARARSWFRTLGGAARHRGEDRQQGGVPHRRVRLNGQSTDKTDAKVTRAGAKRPHSGSSREPRGPLYPEHEPVSPRRRKNLRRSACPAVRT